MSSNGPLQASNPKHFGDGDDVSQLTFQLYPSYVYPEFPWYEETNLCLRSKASSVWALTDHHWRVRRARRALWALAKHQHGADSQSCQANYTPSQLDFCFSLPASKRLKFDLGSSLQPPIFTSNDFTWTWLDLPDTPGTEHKLSRDWDLRKVPYLTSAESSWSERCSNICCSPSPSCQWTVFVWSPWASHGRAVNIESRLRESLAVLGILRRLEEYSSVRLYSLFKISFLFPILRILMINSNWN